MKNLVLIAVETSTENYIVLAAAALILIFVTMVLTMVLTAVFMKKRKQKNNQEQKDNQEQRFKIQIRVQSKELITIIQNVLKELTKKGYPCHIETDGNRFVFCTGNDDNLTQKTFNEIIQNQGCFEIRMMNLWAEDSFQKAVKREIITGFINFIQNGQESQQEQRTYKKLVPRKCTCCGAQLKTGSTVCEFCKTSYIEVG